MKKIIVSVFFVLFGGWVAHADMSGEAFTAQSKATVSWSDMMNREAQVPSSDSKQKPRAIPFMPTPVNTETLQDGDALLMQNPHITPASDSVPYSSFILDENFSALPDNAHVIPPDTMGAVGTQHVMTMLNSEVKIQTKDGAQVGSTVTLEAFWTSVSPVSPFDPILLYDANSSHWIAVVDSDRKSNASRILLAISRDGNPTGTWDFYDLNASDGNNWADYPKVGINAKWIVITQNMYKISNNDYDKAKIWAIDKSTIINSGHLTGKVFSITSGSTLVPAVTLDATEPNIYIVDNSHAHNGHKELRLSEINGTASSPVWSIVPDAHGVSPGSGYFKVHYDFSWHQIDASQKGTSDLISTNDTRIINAVFRNGKLWFAHTGALPDSGTVDRTAIFWYEVDPDLLDTTGDPIVQSGIVDPGSGGHAAFPSIAVNSKNDVVIGFSSFDSSKYAEASFVSRSRNDTNGTMSQMTTLKLGEAIYRKKFSGSRIRWGDYSATVVDPSNDDAFWTLQEYAATPASGGTANDDRWGTWWGRIITSSSPNQTPTADAGADQNVSTGVLVALDGTASFDPDGDPLTYQWTFASRPAGSTATLSNATESQPEFTADVDGNYTVSLTVNDGLVDSTEDNTTISATTPNQTPTADAGADQNVTAGATATLQCAGSDPDGTIAGYRWLQGLTQVATTQTYTTSTLAAGTYTYTCEVTDNDGATGRDDVVVTVHTASGDITGGGCTYNPENRGIDIMMLFMLLGSLAYPFVRSVITQ